MFYFFMKCLKWWQLQWADTTKRVRGIDFASFNNFLLEFWNCSESVVFFAWILELFRECGIFCFSIYCHTKNYMESTITILNTSMIKPRVSDVSGLSSFNYVQFPDSNHYILLSMLICFYTAMNLNWWLNFKKTCLSNHRLLVYSTIIVDT